MGMHLKKAQFKLIKCLLLGVKYCKIIYISVRTYGYEVLEIRRKISKNIGDFLHDAKE
jgi:hypothetical protein